MGKGTSIINTSDENHKESSILGIDSHPSPFVYSTVSYACEFHMNRSSAYLPSASSGIGSTTFHSGCDSLYRIANLKDALLILSVPGLTPAAPVHCVPLCRLGSGTPGCRRLPLCGSLCMRWDGFRARSRRGEGEREHGALVL